MKSGITRILAIIGLMVGVFATPASATNIGFQIAGNQLRVVATDLGTDIIAAWDFDITFDPSLTAILAVTDNQLGVSNVDTVFAANQIGGLIDAFEVSFLSDADLALIQTGAERVLLIITFEQADISNGGFAFVWDDFNDVKCAANRVCFPQQQVPEPGTLLLLASGLGLAMAIGRRRRVS